MMLAVFVVLPSVADTVRVAFALTTVVVIVKLADVLPVRTVTEAGSLRAELLSLSCTTIEAGAGAVRVTVPLLLTPPFTVEGEMLSEASDGPGFSVIVADFEMPLSAAVTVREAVLETEPVVMVKVPKVAPWFTLPVEGVVMNVLLSVS